MIYKRFDTCPTKANKGGEQASSKETQCLKKFLTNREATLTNKHKFKAKAHQLLFGTSTSISQNA